MAQFEFIVPPSPLIQKWYNKNKNYMKILKLKKNSNLLFVKGKHERLVLPLD